MVQEQKVQEQKILGRGFIEETFWVVGHLINIEEHLFESGLVDQASLIRSERKRYVDEWVKALGLREDLVNRDWCIYKHALALMVHLQETAVSDEAVDNVDFLAETARLYNAVKNFTLHLVDYHRSRHE